MIAIIDYQMGNLKSVQKSLETVGYKTIVTADPDKINNADAVIIPGVGAFSGAVENLQKVGMTAAINDFVNTGKPLLGICLGMQLLMSASEENGLHRGLDLIPGEVLKLLSTVKIPHMGWNSVQPKNASTLTGGIEKDSYFYFVHSYYVKPYDNKHIVAVTEYGIEFCSIIQKENIMGVQFHPEKSSSLGQKILINFGRMI